MDFLGSDLERLTRNYCTSKQSWNDKAYKSPFKYLLVYLKYNPQEKSHIIILSYSKYKGPKAFGMHNA